MSQGVARKLVLFSQCLWSVVLFLWLLCLSGTPQTHLKCMTQPREMLRLERTDKRSTWARATLADAGPPPPPIANSSAKTGSYSFFSLKEQSGVWTDYCHRSPLYYLNAKEIVTSVASFKDT